MICHKPETPVVSPKIVHGSTCALYPLKVCIAGLLFSVGCATQQSTVTVHIFGGRSMQGGEHNEMEAPSDVHDLIGDLAVSSGPTPDLKSTIRGGGEVSPAPARKPEEVAPPAGTPSQPSPPPSFSIGPADTEGDQTFLSKPVSERDGYWVILTPAKYNQAIADGGELSVGGHPAIFAGYHNGNRGHWRLEAPGIGTDVEVILADSSGEKVKAWVVPDGSSRYETD